MPAAIEILGLEKTYQVGFLRKVDRVALKPLHLTVEDGECFGFLGPNGAGKTTTLKLLMGLIFPTGGTARILGRDYADPSTKTQLGFLPENPYFYDHLTAGELLDYYGRLSGMPTDLRRRRVDEMLARVGLTEARNLALRKFSKGMIQRVGIAQAIIHEPKIVFLDEPMSGLDPIGRREVRDLIQQMKDEGKTVFFSTHILSDAETLCDRVAVIHKGELRGVGVVDDLARGTSSRIEVVFEGAATAAAVRAVSSAVHVTGNTVRAVVNEEQLDPALDLVRREHARLISVTPVRATLEDYFQAMLGSAPAAAPAAAEVTR
jgi:ABC-2 type transport system ATP-binding protein